MEDPMYTISPYVIRERRETKNPTWPSHQILYVNSAIVSGKTLTLSE